MMFLSKLMNVVSLMMNHIPVIGLSRYTRFNWTGLFPRHGILRYSSDNPKGASHIPIIFIYIYYSIPDYSSSHVLLYIITHRIHVFTINIPHLCQHINTIYIYIYHINGSVMGNRWFHHFSPHSSCQSSQALRLDELCKGYKKEVW